MILTILDTQTGQSLEFEDGANPFWWKEGNGSCDCNRRIWLGIEPENDSDTCEGTKRFIIVACSDKTQSLMDLNMYYDPKLLAKYGIT